MCYCIIYYFAKIKKNPLKTNKRMIFFVLECFWGVKICDGGGMPGEEYVRMFADDGDQVVVALIVYLDVRE